MDTYDFVHLSLHALGGQVSGRTKLQKLMYFAGILTEMIPELGYRPHYYGPYSAEVAGAVDRVRGLGFVDLNMTRATAVDPLGFEVARSDFTLNDEGKRMVEAKARHDPKMWSKIQTAVARLKNASTADYVHLSIAAKIFFMLGEKKETISFGGLAKILHFP